MEDKDKKGVEVEADNFEFIFCAYCGKMYLF